MSVLTILLALAILILLAYRGFSVILAAPLAAGVAILLTNPFLLMPFFSGVFMERMVVFVKLYLPVFLLGALFGRVIEVSGFARSLIVAIVRLVGSERAILAVVLVCALLTYGGISLFVVAFAVYPFGAELFRLADIPKRLLPATIALGAFTFTMDALPGTPQIQNIIPTTFFGTDTWAAPGLGVCGAILIFIAGLLYLRWRQRAAQRAGEGYGTDHRNEPEIVPHCVLPNALLAVTPLVLVVAASKVFTWAIPSIYGHAFLFAPYGLPNSPALSIDNVAALWAVELALVLGIVLVAVTSFRTFRATIHATLNTAITGAMLATLNTASEYGFGGVMAALPGFRTVSAALSQTFHDPLVNAAVTTSTLAGMTGSASGGLSIALGAMGHTYLQQARAVGVSPQVLHRITAMASGGMDTLPHNGAVITLLVVTGLTHRECYRDIFLMTLLKTAVVFVVIAIYYLTGLQ